MFVDDIEKLKREYTDRFVVVHEELPELRRFAGYTGRVKTVNMSGRALVEFDMLENTGWFDIDVDFLKIIDKPLPKKEDAAAEKPAAKATTAAAAQPAAKMSMDEILAAARGGTATPAPTVPPATAKKVQPAAAGQKPSVADVLAAARGETAAAPTEATPTEAAAEQAAPPPKPVAEEPAAEPELAETAATPASKESLPTDPAGIVAWCRERDGA